MASKIEIEIIGEYGYEQSLFGLGKSKGLTSRMKFRDFIYETGANVFDKLTVVAKNLSPKDMGHNKFLESIGVWIDIRASLAWWKQFDTYRIGMTKQSESTMHTFGKRQLTQDDFGQHVDDDYLKVLNDVIASGVIPDDFDEDLPQSFLQTRVCFTNYKTLRAIIMQRKGHKKKQWHALIDVLSKQLEHPELLPFEVK